MTQMRLFSDPIREMTERFVNRWAPKNGRAYVQFRKEFHELLRGYMERRVDEEVADRLKRGSCLPWGEIRS